MSTQEVVAIAFADRPQLRTRTSEALSECPQWSGLFSEISSYVQELKSESSSRTMNGVEPASKKRKLEDGNGKENSDRHDARWPGAFVLPEISFLVPQRKKYTLQMGHEPQQGIRALNPKTMDIEFMIPLDDIEHVVCLPVPEKAQAAYNFCVFPKYCDGIMKAAVGDSTPEPIVWTVPEADTKKQDETQPTQRESIINEMKRSRLKFLEPNASEFVSQIAQPHRKSEKAYHVKAFRGSKDGYLFFLSSGIVWGFKKPLCFFSFDSLESISYTSVLQRTFNLNITTRTLTPDQSEPSIQEFEFSMIDQADFVGIDAYIKRHRLQDASMAEQRRAKRSNVNGVKKEAINEVNREEESELTKARREAEAAEGEEEDEEEEDENFDPGSEGESEGSGSSSEEDNIAVREEGEADGHVEDDELGSGAEGDEM